MSDARDLAAHSESTVSPEPQAGYPDPAVPSVELGARDVHRARPASGHEDGKSHQSNSQYRPISVDTDAIDPASRAPEAIETPSRSCLNSNVQRDLPDFERLCTRSSWLSPTASTPTEKEVVTYQPYRPPDPMPVLSDEGNVREAKALHEMATGADDEREKQPRSRLSSMRIWPRLAILLAILFVLGTAMGLGLKFGLKSTPSRDNRPPQPVSNVSTTGVMQRTGIAVMAMSAHLNPAATVFYQHSSGEIRYMWFSGDGVFHGGTKSEAIALDAKNATPIELVPFWKGSVPEWHVFYIDRNNIVSERVWRNDSRIWLNGPIIEEQLEVYDTPSVGMKACWYGRLYGVTAWTDQSNMPAYGINLWYAKDEDTFEQYGIYEDQPRWSQQEIWDDFNVHAGLGCKSWVGETTIYTMLVNEQNEIEIWWYDASVDEVPTQVHPVDRWARASNVTIPNADAFSSIVLADFAHGDWIFVMHNDSTVRGHQLDLRAESSNVIGEIVIEDSSGPVKFLKGSRITAHAVREPGLDYTLIFGQTSDSEVIMYRKDHDSTSWTSRILPVESK